MKLNESVCARLGMLQSLMSLRLGSRMTFTEEAASTRLRGCLLYQRQTSRQTAEDPQGATVPGSWGTCRRVRKPRVRSMTSVCRYATRATALQEQNLYPVDWSCLRRPRIMHVGSKLLESVLDSTLHTHSVNLPERRASISRRRTKFCCVVKFRLLGAALSATILNESRDINQSIQGMDHKVGVALPNAIAIVTKPMRLSIITSKTKSLNYTIAITQSLHL